VLKARGGEAQGRGAFSGGSNYRQTETDWSELCFGELPKSYRSYNPELKSTINIDQRLPFLTHTYWPREVCFQLSSFNAFPVRCVCKQNSMFLNCTNITRWKNNRKINRVPHEMANVRFRSHIAVRVLPRCII
jgi:hypothetical protein